jgi:hypothetical protein
LGLADAEPDLDGELVDALRRNIQLSAGFAAADPWGEQPETSEQRDGPWGAVPGVERNVPDQRSVARFFRQRLEALTEGEEGAVEVALIVVVSPYSDVVDGRASRWE